MPSHSLNSLLIRFTSWSNKLRDREIRSAPQEASAILSALSQDDPSHSDALDATSVHDNHIPHDEFLCEEHPCEAQQLAFYSPNSPIQKLPVELLAEIFFHCLLTTANGCDSEDDYVTPDIRTAPLLLCRVCMHWRQVAMSTPVLWSSFSALRRLGDHVNSCLMQLWLDCSQTHPLSFHLSIDDRDPTCSHKLLKLFLPHIDRCCDIFIDLDDTIALHLLSISIAQKASIHSVALNTYRCTDEMIKQIPGLISSFTNIRRLTWSTKPSHRPTLLTHIPWSQLTYVLLHFPLRTDDFLAVLAQCSQVVEFTSTRLHPSTLDMPVPTALLPHLRSLQVRCGCSIRISSQCCTSELLQHFTLPTLRTLCIMHLYNNSVTWNPEIFLGFLARSTCPLESLTIHKNNIIEEDLISFLRSPYLQHLKEILFSNSHIADRMLRALTYPSDGGDHGILPCLEKIRLLRCTASDGLFANMIASRWTPTSGVRHCTQPAAILRFVEVHFRISRGPGAQPQTHDRDVACFEKFQAEGLEISWHGI